MKKIILGILATSMISTAFASTLINSYQDARSALTSGSKMTVVFNEEKCNGGAYPVTASLTPHSEMLTSSSILTSDSTITNNDPLAKGSPAREIMNYTFLPNGGSQDNYTCKNIDGCMVLNASVYQLPNNNLIKTFPTISCEIGKTVNLYFT